MDINEILNGKKNAMDQYIAFVKSQSAFSSGAAKLSSGRHTLKKLKMKAGDGLMVVPLMIHLPIGYDGTLLSAGIPYMGSYTSAIKLIKALASTTDAFRVNLKEVLRDDYNKVKFAQVNTVDDEEKEVFKRFRHPLVYAETVMTVKAADSKFAFGTPYRVDIATNPDTGDYIDNPKNPLIWKLHKLETACLATQVKNLRDQNEAMGDARRTNAEIDNTIKDIWGNRCISNPYSLGTTRVLFFETNNSYDPVKEVKDKWAGNEESVRANEYYIKINKTTLEAIEGFIGSKYDRYEDFLLIKQNTPVFEDKTRGTAAQKISRSAAASEDAIENSLTDFISVYAKYRDNLEMWDEKIIKTSAFEYRTISDEAVLDIFRNSMPMLSAAMKSQEIYEKYDDVIAQIDSNLSDELMRSSMDDALPSAGDISTEIAAAPVITENTPGYGGDTMDDSDVTAEKAMMAALTGDSD